MKKNLIETIMGAVVLIVAGFFVATAYQNSGIKNEDGYQISAIFDRIDGVSRGTDVKIGGIKIGTVEDMQLDNTTYRAKLILGIKDSVKLPLDSSAEIASESLLGGKYVNIVPGSEEEMLKSGGKIEFTQSAVNLEQLIGKYAFGSADKKEEVKE
jgi:phospholipid/cholesterol/gamma-HCH transport system substrate-binding protein